MGANGSGISPCAVGQLSPAWVFQFPQGVDGWLNLTGVTLNQFSLILYSVTQVAGQSLYTKIGTGAGIFSSIVNGAGGGISSVQYAPNAADVATAGNFAVRVEVNFNGTSPYYTFYLPLVIQP